MLTQSSGFKHGSVTRKSETLSPAELAMIDLGKSTGLFKVDCTQDAAADFTKDNLAKYDIVMFYTSGNLPIASNDMDNFLNDWLKQEGHGFLGFHSALDTLKDHEGYRTLVGGTFNGHPWGSGNTVTISVHDPNHPTMVPFGSEFQIKDEIYQYNHWVPENCRVLMSLNMAKCKPSKPYHVPVAWVKEWGQGRVYVNNLGHNPSSWQDQRYLKSIANAVRWIRRDVEANASPNPEMSAKLRDLAKKVASEQ